MEGMNLEVPNTSPSLAEEFSILPQVLNLIQGIRDGKEDLELAKMVSFATIIMIFKTNSNY
jgi:hypothetical protein